MTPNDQDYLGGLFDSVEVPNFQRKIAELRALLNSINESADPIYQLKINVRFDSLEKTQELMAELEKYRNGLKNVRDFEILPRLRLIDVYPTMTLEEQVDYVQSRIRAFEKELEEVDNLYQVSKSYIDFIVYINLNNIGAVTSHRKIIEKIKELGGIIKSEHTINDSSSRLMRPLVFQIEFDNN